jgi:hypothetical protein
MEWTKKTWQIAVIITFANLLLSGVIAFTVNAFSARETALQGAASKDYVDQQDGSTLDYVDVQDGAITNRMDRIQLQVNTKADKDDFDKVYLKCEENNKLLFEVLKAVKKLD